MILCLYHAALCENPRHKQHIKAFQTKHPSASKNTTYMIIDINPEDCSADLEYPDGIRQGTVRCVVYKEDTKRVTSLGWNGHPASYNPFEWKVKY
jgi:hypothetical protein